MPTNRRPSNPRWLVYLLRCSDGSLYTGITNDLPKRLKAHAAGKASRYTRSRLPVAVAYAEPQRSKSAALKREAVIKKLPRRTKMKLIAAGLTVRGQSPSMAFGHLADRSKSRGFRRSAVAASCGGRLVPQSAHQAGPPCCLIANKVPHPGGPR